MALEEKYMSKCQFFHDNRPKLMTYLLLLHVFLPFW